MSSSRDDFGIAIRSALLQRGAAQKFSLVSLIILAAIIFFLDSYNIRFIQSARSIINDGVYRISLLASTPTRTLPKISSEILSFIDLKSENERLKLELDIFKRKELEVEYLKNQNKNLQKLLDSDDTLLTYNVVVAKVLIDKSSPFLKSVIINRGTKSGIKKGMPVLIKDYLAGRIVETNYLSSRVLLLSDLNSRIPVTLGENGAQAILTGKGKKNPSLEYLPEDFILKKGVNVFTSGKDGIFLPGTPIGTTTEAGDVKLYVEPDQLSFVKIDLVRQKKERW